MRLVFLIYLLTTTLFGADCLFLSLHPAPTEHFKVFAKELEKEKISTRHVILDPTHEKNEAWAQKIASECLKDKVIITDCGDPFLASIHKHLKLKAPSIKTYFYYDNPEPFVPGGYSDAVAIVAQSPANGVLFANLLLTDAMLLQKDGVEIDLTKMTKAGIGYYPLTDVEKMQQLRSQRKKKEESLTLLYLGGANQYYYDQVIPHFAELLSLSDPLENTTILFQQHPRAKIEGSVDIAYLQKFLPLLEKRGITIKLSTLPIVEAAAIADFVLYSQSGAAPKFVLAGIPLLQISPTPYEDCLVKGKLIRSVSTPESFIRALCETSVPNEEAKKKTLEALGIDMEWRSRLASIIKKAM